MALLVGACATLPNDVARTTTTALPPATDTELGKIATLSSPSDELTGFRLLPVGSFALNTRVTLARHAQRTLDLQYYLIADDQTGRYLLRAVRDAAVRGVRVRLLIDDLYTSGEDPLLLGLAAYPNVQVRLFNPFPAARESLTTRFAIALADVERLNHRMHNKLFIADGVMAVAGGRNIADEYFMRSMTANFVDLDAFVTGAVVPQLSDIYDDYWNSSVVYPLEAIVHSEKSKDELQADFERRTGPENTPDPEPLPSNDVLGYGPLADEISDGKIGLTWAIAFAYADLPSKIQMTDMENHNGTVQYNVISLMRNARKEVVISSPYMIPGKDGMDMIRDGRAKGVTFRILTNSLSATDEPLVHIGYSHYRSEMLELGAELYELSPRRIKTSKRLSMMFGSSKGQLHAKLAIIDRTTLFVGSMNFDPRSAHQNTELGIIVQSPELSREVLRLLDLDRFQSAYRLRLNPTTHEIQWLSTIGDEASVLDSEPDSSFLQRFELNIIAPFAPEELL